MKPPRTFLFGLPFLLFGLSVQSSGVVHAQQETNANARTLSRIDLLQGKVSEALRRDLLGPIQPRAFAPASVQKIAAVGYYGVFRKSLVARLLVLGVRGSNVLQSVTEETSSRINEIQWSPDETRIAYLAASIVPHSYEQTSANRLVVVNVANGAKTTVATDVDSVRWSPDGKSVLYFQHEAAKWRPCRATGAIAAGATTADHPALQITALSEEAFDDPGDFSHDGASFAVFVDNAEEIRIASITDKGSRAKNVPLANADIRISPSGPRLQWSPDDRFLLFHGTRNNFEYSEDVSRLIEIATTKETSLDDTIATGFTDLPVSVHSQINPFMVGALALSWKPGKSRQILVWAAHPRFSSQGGKETGSGSEKWLLYSPDNETLQAANGVDYMDSSGRFHDFAEDISFPEMPHSFLHAVEISWSPDGQIVLINGFAYRANW